MTLRAMVLCCGDERIKTAVANYFCQRRQIKVVKNIKCDGIHRGICEKNLVFPFLEEITSVIRLSLVDIVYLIAHEDCGNYGGSSVFQSTEEEATTLHRDLWSARRIILDRLPPFWSLEIKLLAVIKAVGNWQVYELKHEQVRAIESSIGFISERAKRRMKRRQVRRSRS